MSEFKNTLAQWAYLLTVTAIIVTCTIWMIGSIFDPDRFPLYARVSRTYHSWAWWHYVIWSIALAGVSCRAWVGWRKLLGSRRDVE